MTAQLPPPAAPTQEVWLIEPDADATSATDEHALFPTIGGAAAALAGVAFIAVALRRRLRGRRSKRCDADIAFARLARRLQLSRDERESARSRAASLRVHPVAVLLCERIEPPQAAPGAARNAE